MNPDILPAPKRVGPPDALKLTYSDGSVLNVPYYNLKAARAFLALETTQVTSFEVVPYCG